MSTNANIAIKNENGTYDCIYTHWDGHGHLPILKEFYNSAEKARELVELGSISVLDEKVEPDENLYHGFDGYGMNLPKETHNLSGRQIGVTLTYHRDRGERKEVQRGLKFRELKQEEYLYVWSGERWTKYKC